MVITNLQEKENKKIWVPIRGGNRGGWSLFDWQKVREMPYRDREMYLGNSAKIGVLDKGGKWRRKDWYMKKQDFDEGEQLLFKRQEAIRKDRDRLNAALGLTVKEEDDKLTPAELQMLLKKIKGNNQQPSQVKVAIGLGFDKSKVEIRAKPEVKSYDPHRLQGVGEAEPLPEKKKREESKEKQRKKKHKKEKRARSESSEQRRSRQKGEIVDKKTSKRRSHSDSQQRHKKKRWHHSRSRSQQKEYYRSRRDQKYHDSKHKDQKEKHKSRRERESYEK